MARCACGLSVLKCATAIHLSFRAFTSFLRRATVSRTTERSAVFFDSQIVADLSDFLFARRDDDVQQFFRFRFGIVQT